MRVPLRWTLFIRACRLHLRLRRAWGHTAVQFRETPRFASLNASRVQSLHCDARTTLDRRVATAVFLSLRFFCTPNHYDLHIRNKPRQRVMALLQPRDLIISRIQGHAWLTYYHRYGITGLKVLARQKFAQDLDLHLDSPDFPEACQEAYESTFHTDRGLRDVIIQAFRSNPGLSLRQDVELTVRETPGLAFELYRMASGMPITS
jgi:hypothetical protein